MSFCSPDVLKKKMEYRKHHSDDECYICERNGESYKHWKVIACAFPYDKIATKHDMLTPLRHVASENELNAKERKELLAIKASDSLNKKYDVVIENLSHRKTFVPHFHLHLLKLKD